MTMTARTFVSDDTKPLTSMHPTPCRTTACRRGAPRRLARCGVLPGLALTFGALAATPPADDVIEPSSTTPVSASMPAPTLARQVHDPDAVPEGLSAGDWQQIRDAWQAHRHAVQASDDGREALHARNPGQQWTTEFDGSGFLTRPDHGDWEWGLALTRWGFEDHEITLAGSAEARADGQRAVYRWSEALEEWFINDGRGLEHGYTVHRRPEGHGDTLRFELAMVGGLEPRVEPGGRDIQFVDDTGVTALTYGGLKAWDADGRVLDARFESAGGGFALLVDAAGARYPLTIDPVAQQAYLKASNTGSDLFGSSVAVSGDTVVVGAPHESSNATGVNGDEDDNSVNNSGAAYVFVRDGATWSQQAYLKASNTDSLDRFGRSVAVSGDTVVVGANQEDSSATGVNGPDNDSESNSGAAYVFVRDGTSWSQQAYLKASNTGASDYFGWSVAVSGDTVVVGANNEGGGAPDSGAAYVFVRDGATWSQQAYLKASNTGAGDRFGSSVAVSGDTVLVGAYLEDSDATGVNGNQADNSASDSGAAYVFVRDGATWSQQAYLKASNTDAGDRFGDSVSVFGDTAVVGAPREASAATSVNGNQDDNSENRSGAAYVFVRDGTAWSQQAYLKASNSEASDSFGWSVAVSGDTAVVGANSESSNVTGVNGDGSDNSESNSGAAYVFVRDGATWSEQAYLKASNTASNDKFGGSVAVSGHTVVVGAASEDSAATGVNGDGTDNNAFSSGAAYVFTDTHRAASDFDGDAHSDLLWRDSVGGRNIIWFMDGITRTSSGETITVLDADWSLAALGDFNFDSRTDLLWRSASTGRNVIWLMDGDQRIDSGDTVTLNNPDWSLAGAHDVNGDGKTDLIWRSQSTGRNVVWFMDGTTRIDAGDTLGVAPADWELAGFGDFNGDGRADFLWRHTANGRNVIWLMDGLDRIGHGDTVSLNDPDWELADIEDFDGDGRSDLLWRNTANGRNVIWFMDGITRTGSEDTLGLNDPDWSLVGFGDFNDDRRADFLWHSESTGRNVMWFMDGATRIGSGDSLILPFDPWFPRLE